MGTITNDDGAGGRTSYNDPGYIGDLWGLTGIVLQIYIDDMLNYTKPAHVKATKKPGQRTQQCEAWSNLDIYHKYKDINPDPEPEPQNAGHGRPELVNNR